jgi:radical SAM superfamily enzyme YgiQ (UPF0313 family)
MKILLVLPAGEKYRITKDNPFVPNRKMLRFSILPLTMVAAATPAEYHVEICDENVEMLDFNRDYDVVGVSFMTALAPRAYEIASEFRKRGKTVVAGGYHPTLCPNEAAKYFDAVVVGDAEGLWPKVLNDIALQRLQKIYRHEKPFELSQSPVPRRDLLEHTAKYYITTNAVQIGRGCANRCQYCSVTAFHQGTYRRRPVEQVVAEIGQMPRDIIFVDDNIICDPVYARELFSAMTPLKKRWVSQCSITIGDDSELLTLARKAGCVGLFIGIETGNRKNLELVKKEFNADKNLSTRVDAIHRAGIGIIAGIIVGLDYDDTSTFEQTLFLLQNNHIEAVQVNILTPLPGTPLFNTMKQEGRIVDLDYSKYDFRHVVIEPSRMSRQELQDGADWLYRSFYRLDRIIARTIHEFFTVGPTSAILCWMLGITYRYDNLREHIVGKNPALKNRKKTEMFNISMLYGKEIRRRAV